MTMREHASRVADDVTAELVECAAAPEPEPVLTMLPATPMAVLITDTVRTASIEQVGADPPPED